MSLVQRFWSRTSTSSIKIDGLKSLDANINKFTELFFCTEGKGGVIQIIGEPLFPLRTTIEFVFKEFSGQKVLISKAIQTTKDKKAKGFPQSPYKVNKHEKENTCTDSRKHSLEIAVEGKIVKHTNHKESSAIKHSSKMSSDLVLSNTFHCLENMTSESKEFFKFNFKLKNNKIIHLDVTL